MPNTRNCCQVLSPKGPSGSPAPWPRLQPSPRRPSSPCSAEQPPRPAPPAAPGMTRLPPPAPPTRLQIPSLQLPPLLPAQIRPAPLQPPSHQQQVEQKLPEAMQAPAWPARVQTRGPRAWVRARLQRRGGHQGSPAQRGARTLRLHSLQLPGPAPWLWLMTLGLPPPRSVAQLRGHIACLVRMLLVALGCQAAMRTSLLRACPSPAQLLSSQGPRRLGQAGAAPQMMRLAQMQAWKAMLARLQRAEHLCPHQNLDLLVSLVHSRLWHLRQRPTPRMKWATSCRA